MMMYLPKADPPGSRVSNMEMFVCPSRNTDELLVCCDQRRDLKKKRSKLEGANDYKEINKSSGKA